MERRLQSMDENNKLVTAQLAQVQQQAKLYQDRANLLQKQLGDVTAQAQQQNRLAERNSVVNSTAARGIQASAPLNSSATLSANNTLVQQANTLKIPGAVTEADGDTIRIRIPADQIFTAGSSQLNSSAPATLDAVADVLIRNYPKQRVGVEGHADNGPLYGGSFNSPLQLSTNQAMAVIDYLLKRKQVPENQLFTIGHGTNHPRADNQSALGRAENRRIEIVVYPTTF
jgi:flagellar motor protein MotB